jgi:predicted transcriptional regulator
MATLTLRIDDLLEARLEDKAKSRGVSKSDLAREAIERLLRVEEWKALRTEVMPLFERRGIFTEADVLKAIGEDSCA